MLLAIHSVIIFWIYLVDGNTFIRSDTDSIWQHFRALQYIGEYLRELFQNFIHGNFVIPTWDFTIGMGGNVLTSMHYYGLTDPLSWISAVVPSRYTYILYGALIVLRIFLAGLSFVYMCRVLGVRRNLPIVIGAITYTFSAWSLAYGTWQVMFELPMIYLPALVAAIYRVMIGKNGFGLTIFVFLLSARMSRSVSYW